MNIKSIITYIGLISFIASITIPTHAAPIKIKPVPMLQGSIEYPTPKSWTTLHTDFDAGLNLLINRQFSVWGTGGISFPSPEFSKQFIWTDSEHLKQKAKEKAKQSLQSIYSRACDLEALSLASAHFGFGARMLFTPSLIVGGYYYFDKTACFNRSHEYYHATEILPSSHSIGIEVMYPMIQWNLSGYWKPQRADVAVPEENNSPFPTKKQTGNYIMPPQYAPPTQKERTLPTEHNFIRRLENAAALYSAHDAFMQDQWGITSTLFYVYSAHIKGFLKAYYMNFSEERVAKYNLSLSAGCEYIFHQPFSIAPKIQWNAIQGLQLSCSVHLRWQENNGVRTHYKHANNYLAQPVQREKVPFVLKRDVCYKTINRGRDLLQQNPENVSTELKDALLALIRCYYPGRYITFTEADQHNQKSHTNLDQRNFNELSPYVRAMQDEEGTILMDLLKKTFPARKSYIVTPDKALSIDSGASTVKFASSATAIRSFFDPSPDASVGSSTGRQSSKIPQNQGILSSLFPKSKDTKAKSTSVQLVEDERWYSRREGELIEWWVKLELLEKSKKKVEKVFVLEGTPIIESTPDDSAEVQYQYNDKIKYKRRKNTLQKYSADTGKWQEIKNYEERNTEGKREKMKLYSNLNLIGPRIEINAEGETLVGSQAETRQVI